MIYKNSQHYFVRSSAIGNATTITQTINLPFTPSKMIMHYCFYYVDGTEDGVSFIRCPRLIKNGEGILCMMDDGVMIPKSEFMLGFPLQGNYTFEFVTLAGFLDATRTGQLVIDLEFIEE